MVKYKKKQNRNNRNIVLRPGFFTIGRREIKWNSYKQYDDKQNELQPSDENVFTHNQDLIGNNNEIEDLLREDENKLTLETELA